MPEWVWWVALLSPLLYALTGGFPFAYMPFRLPKSPKCVGDGCWRCRRFRRRYSRYASRRVCYKLISSMERELYVDPPTTDGRCFCRSCRYW